MFRVRIEHSSSDGLYSVGFYEGSSFKLIGYFSDKVEMADAVEAWCMRGEG